MLRIRLYKSARFMSKILISACLSGFPVRYNGSEKILIDQTLQQWREQNRLVICCPELAAGFATPRPPAEIAVRSSGRSVLSEGARVMESSGQDVTERYILGAYLALEMAEKNGCRYALLTDSSPSCGSETIYDGSFGGKMLEGYGVTTELLRQHGIEVFSHRQILQLIERVMNQA